MNKQNKTEADSQIQETNCYLPEEKEELGAREINEGD